MKMGVVMIRKSMIGAAAALVLAACTADPYTGEQKISNTAIGAGTGALLGGVAGLVVGKTTSASTRSAMLIGAGVGAIAGGGAVKPASLKRVRLGVAAPFFSHQDADTRAATDAALARLRAAGVTLVDVQMPRLMELNGAVGFPVALYEAHDDMAAYLAKYHTGIDLQQLAAGIASPDVKATFDGLVLPRKLPAAQGVVDARPAYEHAMRVARPALQKLYRDTFKKYRIDALVFPTVPQVALLATPEASSVQNFGALIQNTDPGSNAGIPGLQLPSGLGRDSGLPIGLELDGPAGSDRHLLALGLAIEPVLGRLPDAK